MSSRLLLMIWMQEFYVLVFITKRMGDEVQNYSVSEINSRTEPTAANIE